MTQTDNTDASNKKFKTKVLEWYIKSGLCLNSYIEKIGKKGEEFTWTSKELEERSEHLKNEAYKEIWPKYKTGYKPLLKKASLEDDASSFNNVNPRSFTFRNKTYEIKVSDGSGGEDTGAWKEMVTKVIELLYDLDPEKGNKIISDLADLPQDEKDRPSQTLRFYTKQQKENIDKGKKSNPIKDGIFHVAIIGSNEARIKMLKDLFTKYKEAGYEIKPEELVFELEPHNNAAKSDEEQNNSV